MKAMKKKEEKKDKSKTCRGGEKGPFSQCVKIYVADLYNYGGLLAT